jgi:hypothetical protein
MWPGQIAVEQQAALCANTDCFRDNATRLGDVMHDAIADHHGERTRTEGQIFRIG